jgi:hypothetical protein
LNFPPNSIMYHILLVICFRVVAVHAIQLRPRIPDPASNCFAVSSTVASCLSATPSLSDAPTQSLAACLCYSSSLFITSWVPDMFDQEVLSCAGSVKTVDPGDYSTFLGLEDFCSSNGDALGAATDVQQTVSTTTQDSAQITETGPIITDSPSTNMFQTAGTMTLNSAQPARTGPITDSFIAPCLTAEAIISSCNAAIPNYSKLDNQGQASCVCYFDGIYDPNGFDVPLSSCAMYIQTAQPLYNSYFAPLVSFCTNYAGRTSTPGRTTTITSPFVTTIVINTAAPTPPSRTTTTVKSIAGPSNWGTAFGKLIWGFVAEALGMVLLL